LNWNLGWAESVDGQVARKLQGEKKNEGGRWGFGVLDLSPLEKSRFPRRRRERSRGGNRAEKEGRNRGIINSLPRSLYLRFISCARFLPFSCYYNLFSLMRRIISICKKRGIYKRVRSVKSGKLKNLQHIHTGEIMDLAVFFFRVLLFHK
jgi:hypothetical protein